MPTMTHLCERCRCSGPLFHCRAVDEYLCEVCLSEALVEEREVDEVEA